jgi:hypothetical protein
MATKKTILTKDAIVSMYMNYRLENNGKPKSVYQFAKLNNIEESQFYSFFGTLESIEKIIFKMFFDKTIELIQKDSNYENYDTKSKLLSFYFTFFEILAANRSYVALSLEEHQNHLKNLLQLTSLRSSFKHFISEIYSDSNISQNEKFHNFQKKAIQEMAWIEFLMTLKFWLDDESPSFEKTDLFIEKSLKLSFELVNTAPLDSLIDLGKFLFKEKTQNN